MMKRPSEAGAVLQSHSPLFHGLITKLILSHKSSKNTSLLNRKGYEPYSLKQYHMFCKKKKYIYIYFKIL